MMLLRLLGLCGVCMLVAACSASDDELQAWMLAQRNVVPPKVLALAEPKKFEPQSYTQGGRVDPFDVQKLTQALQRDAAQSASSVALIGPELARRKESLEAYPLDTMVMVGSLQKSSLPVALVQVDKLLYQVRQGNYLGQNYGRVIKVTETELVLREIVQDATGDWIERMATLHLQENSQ